MHTAQVVLNTMLLRFGDDPVWARLRELLIDEGFDPLQVALADFFPDDVDMEFGVLVSPDGRVLEFEFRYGAGDLTQQVQTARLTGWFDRTDYWQAIPSAERVRAALRLLQEGRS